MKNYSLTQRLNWLAVVGIAGLMIAGAAGIAGSYFLGNSFSEYRVVARAQKSISNINNAFLAARIVGLKYRLGAHNELDNAVLHFDRINQEIDILRSLALDQSTTGQVDSLSTDVKAYFILLQELRPSAREETQDVQVQLDLVGPRVASMLNEISLNLQQRQDTLGPQGDARSSATLLVITILMIVMLLLTIGFTQIVKRLTQRQIVELSNAISELTKTDNYDVAIPGTEIAGRLGAIATNVYKLQTMLLNRKIKMKEDAEARQRAEQEQSKQREAATAAQAQFEAEAIEKQNREKAAAREELASAFEQTVNARLAAVSSSSTQLLQSSKGLSDVSSGLQSGSAEALENTQSTSQSVSSVTAALEELTASTEEVRFQISKVAQSSQEAVKQSDATSEIMSNLQANVDQITTVLALITDISDQTNLLALNATIEAARAGDAGKGFAVVASEVKSLAKESANAAATIAKMIEQIKLVSAQSVEALQVISSNIYDVNTDAVSVSSAAEEQAKAALEISRSAQIASASTHAVSEIVECVSGRSLDSQKMSAEVKEAAQLLSSETRNLSNEAESFLSKIRA